MLTKDVGRWWTELPRALRQVCSSLRNALLTSSLLKQSITAQRGNVIGPRNFLSLRFQAPFRDGTVAGTENLRAGGSKICPVTFSGSFDSHSCCSNKWRVVIFESLLLYSLLGNLLLGFQSAYWRWKSVVIVEATNSVRNWAQSVCRTLWCKGCNMSCILRGYFLLEKLAGAHPTEPSREDSGVLLITGDDSDIRLQVSIVYVFKVPLSEQEWATPSMSLETSYLNGCLHTVSKKCIPLKGNTWHNTDDFLLSTVRQGLSAPYLHINVHALEEALEFSEYFVCLFETQQGSNVIFAQYVQSNV